MIEIPRCPACQRMAVSAGLQARRTSWQIVFLCINYGCGNNNQEVDPVWIEVRETDDPSRTKV